MGKIEKTAGVVGILVSLAGLYDAHVTRRTNRAVREKEDEIRKLKEKLAKFEDEKKVT